MNYYEKMLAEQSALSMARLGFDVTKVNQGSPEWMSSRLGVITASRASDLIATGPLAPFPDDLEIVKVGRSNSVTFRGVEFTGTKADCVSWVRNQLPRQTSPARDGYLLDLVAEVATGQQAEPGSFKQAEWGHEYEDHARQIFAFHVGVPVNPIAFIYGDKTMRYGCSPDGIADDNSGVEIKCPWTTKVYLDFLVNGQIKQEYIDQVQFSMFVTGRKYWHFANYDPRMKVQSFHAVTLERDEKKMDVFSIAVAEMSRDMDAMLDRIGLKFGDQWITSTH